MLRPRVLWCTVAGQIRPKAPKLATPMHAADKDARAYMHSPAAHMAKLHSTNPMKWLNSQSRPMQAAPGFPDPTRQQA